MKRVSYKKCDSSSKLLWLLRPTQHDKVCTSILRHIVHTSQETSFASFFVWNQFFYYVKCFHNSFSTYVSVMWCRVVYERIWIVDSKCCASICNTCVKYEYTNATFASWILEARNFKRKWKADMEDQRLTCFIIYQIQPFFVQVVDEIIESYKLSTTTMDLIYVHGRKT